MAHLRLLRLDALLYAALAEVNDPRKAEFGQVAKATAASNLIRPTALRDALAAFDASGVEYALFKGAALVLAYPELGAVRPVSDADVLVAPRDFRRARQLLRAEGFAEHDPGQPVSGGWNNERGFVRDGPPELHIDLHRGLHRRPLFERVSALALRSAVRRNGLWIVAPPLAPLVTAAHRAKHGYSGDARELLDLHVVLTALPEVDIARLPRTAVETGCAGALYCAWTLARWWFGSAGQASDEAYARLATHVAATRPVLDALASLDSPSDADKPWRAAPFLKMYLPMPLLTGEFRASLRLAATHAVLRGLDVVVAGPGALDAVAVRRASAARAPTRGS